MNKSFTFLFVFLFMFCFINAEESFDVSQISCDDFIKLIDIQFKSVQLPEQVPFSNEVINLYIDEKYMGSISIENKSIEDVSCSNEDNATFNVYVNSDIFSEINDNTNYIEFYNEKKSSGDIRIEAVGFTRNIKLFFMNFGVKIANWFN